MKRLLTLASAALVLLIGAGAGAGGDDRGTLIVTATGFKNHDGDAIVALYENGAHWLDIGKAYRTDKVSMKKMKKGTVRFTLRNVPYGEYGLTVLHDENENGRLDMRWVPYPKPLEYGGISNNWIRSGKPEYSKAKFKLNRRIMSLRIIMRK
jgi:uncharacterized protein (DUF2141 family)